MHEGVLGGVFLYNGKDPRSIQYQAQDYGLPEVRWR